MESGVAVGEVGRIWVDDVFLDVRLLKWNDFGFDVFGSFAHEWLVAIDVDDFLSVLRQSSKFGGNGIDEVFEVAGFDLVFELNGMRKANGNPDGDLWLEPSGKEFGLVWTLTVDFYDIEWLFVLVEDGTKWSGRQEINPAEFGASNSLHTENIKRNTEGGVGIVGIVGELAHFVLSNVKSGGLPCGTGNSDDTWMPASKRAIGEMAEIFCNGKVKTLLEFSD